MKRKNNLYQALYDLTNIEKVFNEICSNTNIFIFEPKKKELLARLL